ncbi:hypothetical protein IMY05_C4804000100 [Salix suchowensis]|nr:hypothetical protein IMY05_C4804000100 [Salix suchowensis]
MLTHMVSQIYTEEEFKAICTVDKELPTSSRDELEYFTKISSQILTWFREDNPMGNMNVNRGVWKQMSATVWVNDPLTAYFKNLLPLTPISWLICHTDLLVPQYIAQCHAIKLQQDPKTATAIKKHKSSRLEALCTTRLRRKEEGQRTRLRQADRWALTSIRVKAAEHVLVQEVIAPELPSLILETLDDTGYRIERCRRHRDNHAFSMTLSYTGGDYSQYIMLICIFWSFD